MIGEALPLLANHLWQSTLFAGAAGLLVLFLKRNRAAVRYVVWLAASVKFLLPFSLLITLGSQFEWPTERVEAPQALAYALEGFSQPFAVQPSVEPSVPSSANIGRTPLRERIPTLLFVVWFIGAVFVGLRWFVEWWRMRVSLRAAVLLDMKVPIRVLVTPSPVEPGVVGILRPALLLPRGLMDRLTPEQLHAVLMHELCHVRRLDNLAAAMHMLVEKPSEN